MTAFKRTFSNSSVKVKRKQFDVTESKFKPFEYKNPMYGNIQIALKSVSRKNSNDIWVKRKPRDQIPSNEKQQRLVIERVISI